VQRRNERLFGSLLATRLPTENPGLLVEDLAVHGLIWVG
jgi:hypothetical protein